MNINYDGIDDCEAVKQEKTSMYSTEWSYNVPFLSGGYWWNMLFNDRNKADEFYKIIKKGKE